jgi:hypothetical protein
MNRMLLAQQCSIQPRFDGVREFYLANDKQRRITPHDKSQRVLETVPRVSLHGSWLGLVLRLAIRSRIDRSCRVRDCLRQFLAHHYDSRSREDFDDPGYTVACGGRFDLARCGFGLPK